MAAVTEKKKLGVVFETLLTSVARPGMERIPHGLKLDGPAYSVFKMIFIISKITKKTSWLAQSAL